MDFTYIILLYGGGLLCIIAEIFIPGGIVGIAGAIGMGISIYYAFISYGILFGVTLLLAALILLPLIIFFALKKLRLSKTLNTEDGFISQGPELEKMIGKEGIAFTYLRPAGTALIEGKKVDVVTEGGMIDKDAAVKVIKVEGVKVIVRAK
jgi:membrane-bound serine protease (ClpP class)